MDNLFVHDFNAKSREFTLMMIDTIAEVSYIIPMRTTKRDLMNINYSFVK